MNKRDTITAVVLSATLLAGGAETNDWENTQVTERNRLPARTYALPLADAAAAFTDALEPETPYRQSLNGTWKIKWVGDPARRPDGFWAPDYDDADWSEVDVPSCLEMRGFGSPQYTNVNYPHKIEWPTIRDRFTGRADAAYRTVAELAAVRADLLKPGDTVLLKASHGLHLGDILNETTST